MSVLNQKQKMWKSSINIAIVVFVILLIYVYLYNGDLNLLVFSQTIAGTAGIMIGLSFAMSSVGYFWDFLDQKVAYRKYYGLVGFWLALLYSISLLFVDPDKYFYNFFDNILKADFLLGLSAMAILTFMAIISNNWLIVKLGPKLWRLLLRFGYIAYGLLIVRAIVLEGSLWLDWAGSIDTVPPPRIIISAFALFVIFLRTALFISKRLQHQKHPVTETKEPIF